MSATGKRPRARTIRVEALARVEGEGAMRIRVRGDVVERVELAIYEPPRFFEAFLRGRDFREAPDITSRICGICPIAYQTSAANALEAACGVSLPAEAADLRRLLYCGEWIESHALHVLLLHAPDFLGFESGIEIARDHPDLLRRALNLKRAGNRIVAAIGGREIHPVNLRVGGFYSLPSSEALGTLRDDLEAARDAACELTEFAAGFTFPSLERDVEMVCLHRPDRYAIEGGRIISSRGLDFAAEEWQDHVIEEHVPWSNALQARLAGRGRYLVGPSARVAVNFEQLPPLAREAADRAGLTPASLSNPFRSILARCVELVFATDEALRLLESWTGGGEAAAVVEPRAAVGHGVSEAPRGVLYHRYRIDADGLIEEADIVPPTSQNQATIEDDLRELVAANVALPDDELQRLSEHAIRNYDPCISCATHFLKLEVERA
jgi:coenzyme F420-reducing hydrogenase alpha subunit